MARGGDAKKTGRHDMAQRTAVTVSVAAVSVLVLAFLVLYNGDVVVRVLAALFVLAVSGRLIARANGVKDSYGAYMLGGKRGIKAIELLSKRWQGAWLAFADWGLAFSFGAASLLMFRNRLSKKAILVGIISIILILVFVFPYLSLVLDFISIPQITSHISAASASAGPSILFYVLVLLSVLGGFSAATIFLIFYSGVSILYETLLFVFGLLTQHPNPALLTSQVPGVAPLIPGLTIPLFAGLVTLILLLVVHEFSHGVLAKIARIRIKSIGAILFGIVPLGAFVEPDEKQVGKLGKQAQDRISVAGVSANMLTCLFFFVLTLATIYFVFPGISTGGVLVTHTVKGYPAYGIIPNGTVITGWNNASIANSYDLANVEAAYVAGTHVMLRTSNGTIGIVPESTGELGILTAPAVQTAGYQAANFFFAIFVLSFGLNFFVAIFNLLPLPFFDGWRIYKNSIRSKRVLNALAALVVVSILLNILPWFWSAA